MRLPIIKSEYSMMTKYFERDILFQLVFPSFIGDERKVIVFFCFILVQKNVCDLIDPLQLLKVEINRTTLSTDGFLTKSIICIEQQFKILRNFFILTEI